MANGSSPNKRNDKKRKFGKPGRKNPAMRLCVNKIDFTSSLEFSKRKK